MNTPSARVTRITIGRLHNLGDYEHVRFEVALDVGPDDAPGDALFRLTRILNDCGPVKVSYEEKRARLLVKRADDGEDLSEYDRKDLDAARATVGALEERRQRHRSARARLNALGGKSEYRDAKEDWDAKED